jgi:hypothetical protein
LGIHCFEQILQNPNRIRGINILLNEIIRGKIPQKAGILVDQTTPASYSLHNPEIYSIKDVNRVVNM